MKSAPRFAIALAGLALPAQALAVSVFVNGTKVDGLTGAKIEKCAVEFDAKGNVQLTCPGYAVRVEGEGPVAEADESAAPRLTRKYFLVTEQAEQGAAEFDVELYVNAKFVRKLRSDEEQIVTEITRHLSPGKNALTFVARKKQGEARRSSSKAHFFRVIIGEGNASADRVMIDDPVITFERTAADNQDSTQEFTLVTH